MKREQESSLTSRAVAMLRDDIVKLAFASDHRLNIETLKQRYAMGGTPVREALNQLIGERFVEAMALKGFRVTTTSLEQCCDLLHARRLLEVDLLHCAIQQGDDLWEANCVGAHYRFLKFEQNCDEFTAETIEAWFERYHSFLQALFCVSGSVWLLGIYDNLLQHFKRYHYTVYHQASNFEPSMVYVANDYADIMQAVSDRHAKQAVDAVKSLHDNVLQKMNNVWPEYL
jgi:GntR family transcriptional regulator, carbon starvation induced regulator